MESSVRRERKTPHAGACLPPQRHGACIYEVKESSGRHGARDLSGRVLSSAAKPGRAKKYLLEQGRGSRRKAMDGGSIESSVRS